MTLPALNAPPNRTPMVDEKGLPTPPWAKWFELLWRKTGEASNTAPINVSGQAATAITAENAAKANYTVTPASPVTAEDVGAGVGRILIAAASIKWDDMAAPVLYAAAVLTIDDIGATLPNNAAYYIYRDDPNRNGAGAWLATTDYAKLAATGRVHLRGVTIPAGGAPANNGTAAGGVGKYTDIELA